MIDFRGESTLEELLGDPIVAAMLRSDKLDEIALRGLLRDARRRAAAATLSAAARPLPFRSASGPQDGS